MLYVFLASRYTAGHERQVPPPLVSVQPKDDVRGGDVGSDFDRHGCACLSAIRSASDDIENRSRIAFPESHAKSNAGFSQLPKWSGLVAQAFHQKAPLPGSALGRCHRRRLADTIRGNGA